MPLILVLLSVSGVLGLPVSLLNLPYPSMVALVFANLISCTNYKVLIMLGGPFYDSFAA